MHDIQVHRVVPGVVAGMPDTDGVEIRIRFLLAGEYETSPDLDWIHIVHVRDSGKINSSRACVADSSYRVCENLALDIQVVLDHVWRP
jgi:hypothetical protein